MKRVIKTDNSEIVKKNLRYKNGDNSILRDLLKAEQNNICAYTENYLGRSYKTEIDHFNPNLKATENDNYYNYFAVSGQWNNEKGEKWIEQIMHPTDEKFNERIVYENGDYKLANLEDTEAKNTFEILNLFDPDLADERKRYISRLKENIAALSIEPKLFIKVMLEKNPNEIYFIRAIEEEFGIVVFD